MLYDDRVGSHRIVRRQGAFIFHTGGGTALTMPSMEKKMQSTVRVHAQQHEVGFASELAPSPRL